MGELFGPSENSSNDDTLGWSEVEFSGKQYVVIHVRHPMSKRPGCEKIEVFSFHRSQLLPCQSPPAPDRTRPNHNIDLPVFSYLSQSGFNDRHKILLLQGQYSVSTLCKAGSCLD
jgi:hypothetical protein